MVSSNSNAAAQQSVIAAALEEADLVVYAGDVQADPGEAGGPVTVAVADCGSAFSAWPPESIVATQVVRRLELW